MSRRTAIVLIAASVALAACGASGDVRREVTRQRAALLASADGSAAAEFADTFTEAAPSGESLASGDVPVMPGSPSEADPAAPTVGTRPSSGAVTATTGPGSARPGPTGGPVVNPAAPSGGEGGAPGAAGPGGAPTGGAPAPSGDNGGATDIGVSADTIKVGGIFFNGSWLDRYVQVAEQAARAYFRYVNDQGGIHGRKIDYISCDTAATADGTQSCARKLGDAEKVFAFGPSMDVYSNVITEYITQRQIPSVGSMAYYLDDLTNPYIFPTQLSSLELAALIGTFSAQQLGVKTVGVLWIKDFIGADCLDQVRKTGQKLGYQVVVEASSGTTEDDMTPQVIKMRTTNPVPEAVLFCTDAVNQTKFMQAAARQNWAPTKGWVAAYAAIDDVPKAIGPTAKGMYSLTTYDYYGGDTPGVQQYRKITNFYYPSMFHHFFSQATYVGAVALVEAMRLAGPNLTRPGVLKALRSMRSFDSGMGLTFDFGDKASGRSASGLMLQADASLNYRVATGRFRPVL